MSEPLREGTVLKTGKAGQKAEALRRSIDRRNLLTAVAVALLLHLLIVLGFLLADILGVRDISDWSGPVMVKIGAPEAPESPKPDPGELPEQSDVPVPEPPETPTEPSEPAEAQPEAAPSTPDTSSESATPTPPVDSGAGGSGEEVESPFAEPQQAAQPQPSRVQGSEDGNNYEIDFDGTDDEVGRAGAYGFITSYMPLPQTMDEEMVAGAVEYLKMSPEMIKGEIERFWVLSFGTYEKKVDSIPMDLRSYYWDILSNSLGYDIENPEWKTPNMRSVTIEFTVSPSVGTQGASLSDFKMITRTNNPAIDEAVIYGLSRWVYYNDTGRPVNGRITYEFD